MRTYKFLTLCAAIAIIVLEAFFFSHASMDAPDIGTTTTSVTPDSPS